MKKWVGIVIATGLIIACFLPWVYISSKHVTITGMDAQAIHFGKPGVIHVVVSVFFILFTLVARVWAARTNLILTAINIAWAVRNFFLISACGGGECPAKKVGLYIVLILSICLFISSFYPPISLDED